MAKRLLVFGGSGFVGAHLARLACNTGWQVLATDRTGRLNLPGVQTRAVEIDHFEEVQAAMNDFNPNAVVNAAAIADIDRASREPETTWAINVNGAGAIAEASNAMRVRMIHLSSDAVYSGRKGSLYIESDLPNPVNYYGRTKAAAEYAVRGACPQAPIVRISIILGYPVVLGMTPYLVRLEEQLRSGKPIPIPVEEVRTPIDVQSLCTALLELCENDFSGTLQLGASESADRMRLGKVLARSLGYDDSVIVPAPVSGIPGREPRHTDGSMDVGLAQRTLKTHMLSLEDTIQRALEGR